MDRIHISLDTESWGKRAGCDARSIGAVLFNLDDTRDQIVSRVDTQESFYTACHNPLLGMYDENSFTPRELDLIDGNHRRYNLFRDPETVNWWYQQSPEAQGAFENPLELKHALIELSGWMEKMGVDRYSDNACIWTHGAAFDLPNVEAWYHAVGLPVPWFYRAPRDTRTCFDIAQVGSHSQWLKQCNYGVKHQALHDGVSQAIAISSSYQKIQDRSS